MSTARSAEIAQFFEALSPATLPQLGHIYAANARFKDPFNDVTGLPAIQAVFEHMYVSLHEPRFVVTQQIADGEHLVLLWDFKFRFKRFDTVTEQVVKGASHLALDEQGLVTLHRDYWDVAEELYEKLPYLGAFMRWLKARARS
jgi:steroid Delta-isomerase